MSRINILLLIAILNALLSSQAFAQESIVNKMGDYLVKVKEIDSAVYYVKTQLKKQEIVTNFYVNKLLSIRSNNKQVVFYKFGSFTEHQRPHFSLITDGDLHSICIVDCTNVEEGVKALLACLLESGWNCNERIRKF